jgi:phosphoribosylformylglycinamidine cyclo-ligase
MSGRYREAGVDLAEGDRAVRAITEIASRTAGTQVIGGIGGFGSLFAFDAARWPDPVLVSSTDGVGTKLKVAIALGRFDTIGMDLVNHCLNDVAVSGADPLFFLDYLATGRLDANRAAALVGGMAAACSDAGVSLVGGETAELPGLYAGDDFDLAGFCVGAVARADIIDGSAVRPGDVLIGLPSSGLHTNGYSLVRRLFGPDEYATALAEMDTSLGDALLAPHRSYLPAIRSLRSALRAGGGDLLSLAHLTGGGWEGNIPRTLPDGCGVAVRRDAWPVPPLFRRIVERGQLAESEAFATFNMGIGLTAVVPADLEAQALAALPDAIRLGQVVPVAQGEPRVQWQ